MNRINQRAFTPSECTPSLIKSPHADIGDNEYTVHGYVLYLDLHGNYVCIGNVTHAIFNE